MSMSAAVKKGLWLLYQELTPPSHTPYDLYKTLDLGPGGYARAPSTDVQRGVREALYQKFRR